MEDILKNLASGGVPGAILAYILWRVVPAMAGFRDDICESMRQVEVALDRSARADLIRLTASPLVSDAVKAAAADLLREISEADTRREALKPKQLQ